MTSIKDADLQNAMLGGWARLFRGTGSYRFAGPLSAWDAVEELRSARDGSIALLRCESDRLPNFIYEAGSVVLNKPSKQVRECLQRAGTTLLPFSYSCPDCGWEIETLVLEVTSSERDTYQSTVCPNCQQLHSVSAANGEILVADGLGDP